MLQAAGFDITQRQLPTVAGAALGGTAAALATRGRDWSRLARVAAPAAGLVAGGLAGAAIGALVARFSTGTSLPPGTGPGPVAPSGRPAPAPGTVRVMSLNIHHLVPDGIDLGDAGEREAALADVARYVSDVDPDIVLVQEVDDDRARPGKDGVVEQHARLREALGASDAAFAAASVREPGDRYGIAIYARNGIMLHGERAITLPHTPGYEARQLLEATARLPDGSQLTVLDTHLDHTGRDRPRQLAAVARHAATIEGAAVLGGDFNAATATVDDALAGTGFANVLSLAERSGRPQPETAAAPTYRDRRIDHLLATPGAELDATWVEEVPMRELDEGAGVTDHRAVVADVHLP